MVSTIMAHTTMAHNLLLGIIYLFMTFSALFMRAGRGQPGSEITWTLPTSLGHYTYNLAMIPFSFLAYEVAI